MASNACLVNTVDVPVGTSTNPLYTTTSGSVPAGGPSTGTQSSVDSGTSSVTILAANANRFGAGVTNTDANALLLLLGTATASATAYTVKLVTDAYYEVPFGFKGQLTGIWVGNGSGAALVTELT